MRGAHNDGGLGTSGANRAPERSTAAKAERILIVAHFQV
jgi:hypothetical protein